MHATFEKTRVNAQNFRKEFFRASIDDVEAALKRLAPDAPFIKDVEAQEYQETLARRQSARLAADKGYDADWLRTDLREKGITPIIPGKRGRKRNIRHDKRRYRERWRVEASFCRLKDFRPIATRYDTLARNYASASALATVIAFWC